MKKFKIYLSLCLVTLCSILMCGCLGGEKPPPTFSISGYVLEDEIGVEGVTVKCDVGTTTTDENGYYVFDGLTSGVTISVEKQNYAFDKQTQTFFSNTTQANFNAYSYYNVSGVVKSGAVPISNAKVVATGNKGGFAYSTESGQFIIYNVAGEVSITVDKQGYTFFEKTANRSNNQIELNSTTNISGTINYIGKSINNKNDVVLYVNNEPVEFDGTNFSLKDLTLGTKIKPLCESLVFEPNEVTVSQENQEISFSCQKLYSYSGIVKSGETPLNNVVVSCGDTTTTTDESGVFTLNNLLGQNSISASKNAYEFNHLVVDENTIGGGCIYGTTTISGVICFENMPLSGVVVGCVNNTYTTKTNGEFSLSNLSVGDTISISKEGYVFSQNEIIIEAENQEFFIVAEKLFNAKIIVASYNDIVLSDVCITVNEQNYTTDKNGEVVIENLIGSHRISLYLDNYLIETSEILSYKNATINVFAEPYYNISGKVYSGNINLNNATITYNNKTISVSENAEFSLTNLIKSNVLNIACEGYNSKQISVDYQTNEIFVELNYDISGRVISGDVGVRSAKIYNENFETYTDKNGDFCITNIVGENVYNVEKEFYTFSNSIYVNKGLNNILVDSTYEIYGCASNGEDVIQNATILMTNVKSGNTISTTTNENGEYKFDNVSGKNLLFYETPDNLKLRPAFYSVSESGEYNFMLNGYELGGYVVCNGVGVQDVLVTAGNAKTYTDETGRYYFSLLTTDCTIMASKEGYDFSPNAIDVTSDDNEKTNINFIATYKLQGYVKSGETPVSEVKVQVGNNITYTDINGFFSILGLSGECEVVIEKQGYSFIYDKTISEYTSLQIQATFGITGIVKTGNIFISGVVVKYNNIQTTTNANGEFSLSGLTSPAVLTFEKQGYEFEDCGEISAPANINVSATYSLSGIVKSGITPISAVSVTYNGKTILTNSNGEFNISGIIGEITISFEKIGYTFETVTIFESKSIIVYATFSVSGKITLGDNPLSGVLISCQNKTALTDENGNYMLSGLSGEGELVIEKRGYSFTGETYFDGSAQLDFKASYSISGYVKSGDLTLDNVQLKIGNDEIFTDANGYFSISGLTSAVSIIFKKSGYDQVTKECNDFAENIEINMAYSISVNFKGISDYSNITISIENANETKTLTASNQLYTVKNIYGSAYVSFEKSGYLFTPAKVGVTKPTTLSITISEIYSITGKITVADTSIPVAGMKITAGNQTVYTNTSGDYSISNLVGTQVLKGELSHNNCTSVTTESIQISQTGVKNLTISSQSYIYFLFERGYQLLTESASSYIKVKGIVELTQGGTQQVGGIKKRDSNGIVFTEKTNYGKEVLGIDPKVAVLTYYNTHTGETKYQQVKDVYLDGDVYKANYGGFTDSSVSNYKSVYGVNPYDQYAYIINKSTIQSYSDLTKGNGTISFKLTLNPSTAVSNYIKQMSALSGQTPSKFNYVYLTYTLDDNGYLKTLHIEEQYEVVVVITVTGTGDITETFYTTDATTELTDVDINDIYGSLEYKVKTQPAILSSGINIKNKQKGEDEGNEE